MKQGYKKKDTLFIIYFLIGIIFSDRKNINDVKHNCTIALETSTSELYIKVSSIMLVYWMCASFFLYYVKF